VDPSRSARRNRAETEVIRSHTFPPTSYNPHPFAN
jgi:hypothetical protein